MVNWKRWTKIGLIFVVGMLLLLWIAGQVIYRVSAAPYSQDPLPPGNGSVPVLRSLQWNAESDLSRQVSED